MGLADLSPACAQRCWTGAALNFGEPRHGEVRRIHLLGTRVNRALGEAIMLSRTKEEAPGERAGTCGRQGGAGDGR
jgi:hypothetical protein